VEELGCDDSDDVELYDDSLRWAEVDGVALGCIEICDEVT
jgi:hypothetical protein